MITSHRILTGLLCLSLLFGLCGPIDFIPSAEAATSAQKRKTRKLKKDNRKLKKQNRSLRMQLAAALVPLAPLVPPPTPGMVLIPAGNFMMGDADNGSTGGVASELPVHAVTVSAFYIDKFEVTKALWDKVAAWGGTNGYSDLPAGGGQGKFHPVQSVSWYAVVKWLNARSEMEGLTPVYYTDAAQTTVYRTTEIDLENSFVKWTANGFRLPTEAEWEKAARGMLAGNTYPWGNSLGGGDANYKVSGDPFESAGTPTTPVGFYDGGQIPVGVDRANGYGLYDVAGNVNEWCWDWFDADYYGPPAPPNSDPRGPAGTSSNRAVRGGSWNSANSATIPVRCANRGNSPSTFNNGNIGFRSARGL